MSTAQRQKFKETQEVDLAYSVPGPRPLPLQRLPAARHRRPGPPRHPDADPHRSTSSGLPQVLKKIADEERGLVLVTGTTGSGKSTTLAAMIDHINQTRCAHVMTVEDPIEFLHRDSQVDHQPARGRGRHAVVRAGAAQRAAAGSRRHPRRRDARLRDDRDRPARGRNRPPRVLDAAHARRDRDDQPHHRRLPAAPAEAGPPAAGQRAQGGGLAAPDAARSTARAARRRSRS